MKKVYMVTHLDPKNDDEKYIGIYWTYEEASSVVERFKKMKGFCDSTEGFYIDKYELDKLYWPEGYYSKKIKAQVKIYRWK